MRLATLRDLVVARAAPVLRDAPLGRDELASLETVQALVERAVIDVEGAARLLLEPVRDLEAVHGLPHERPENEQVERALHQHERLWRCHRFSFQTLDSDSGGRMERRLPCVKLALLLTA